MHPQDKISDFVAKLSLLKESRYSFKGLQSNILFREKFVIICFIFIRKFVSLITRFGYILIFATVVFHSIRIFASNRKVRYMFYTNPFLSPLFPIKFILCFHYIWSPFGPFRNDLSHFAVQWKQKCFWIDPIRFLFPFGAIR